MVAGADFGVFALNDERDYFITLGEEVFAIPGFLFDLLNLGHKALFDLDR